VNALLAPLLIAQAAVPAPAFAPPLATPFRIVTERIQIGGDRQQHHRTERMLRFGRNALGLYAEVTLIAATAPTPGDAADMFEAGYRGLLGRTIVLRLDESGNVSEIEDLDSLWEAFCRGVAAMAASRRTDAGAEEREAFAERIAATLRVSPIARRRAAFATLVSEAIADDGFAQPHGIPLSVEVPGRTPFGGAVTLQGMRRVDRAEGLLRSTTEASGTVPLPPAAGTAESAVMTIAIERTADPATGLLRTARETVRTSIGEDDARRELSVVSTVHIERVR